LMLFYWNLIVIYNLIILWLLGVFGS